MAKILLGSLIFALGGVLVSVPQMGTQGVTTDTWFSRAGEIRAQHLAMVVLNTIVFAFTLGAFVHCFQRGVTTGLKVTTLSIGFAYFMTASVLWRAVPYHLLVMPLVDLAHILGTPADSKLLSRLAILMLVGQVLYISLHLWGEYTHNSILAWGYDEKVNWYGFVGANTLPPIVNHFLIKSYVKSWRIEQENQRVSTNLAHSIAQLLANFDLEQAEKLLSGANKGDAEMPIIKPLANLLASLRCYSAFLPEALFSRDGEVFISPNQEIHEAMHNEQTKWDNVDRAVNNMRNSAYTLRAFHDDVADAFPELQLYGWQGGKMSSGLAGGDEYQRTLGAFYSVYCLCRLDIDGKEIFSFGIDNDGGPLYRPQGELAAKQQAFYDIMPWKRAQELMERSGMLYRGPTSQGAAIMCCKPRVKAMLALTAIHDVMKNTMLLPTVQPHHAPYMGYNAGAVINDHDIALAYVLEHFPSLMPSFYGLEAGQRAPILFTQSKMGFNNGWLVQGEAPPAALFRTFKKVIENSRASRADVALYFVHWLTDLAGAEPFGTRPWPGSEKFTTKFPAKVLAAFLDSFTFVDRLAISTEVQAMEEYLLDSWTHGDISYRSDAELAAMRLGLMAQGFEREVVMALEGLDPENRSVIVTEMSRTGCTEQYERVPQSVKDSPFGPAFLVYYAPALIQKAKAKECSAALEVLAEVFRAARRQFPLAMASVEDTATIRIDVLKVHTPSELEKNGPFYLKRLGELEAEVVAGWPPADAPDREAVLLLLGDELRAV